jgi:hypothetical protein
MSDQRWPAYRLIGGDICRQDVSGGDWEPLDRAQAQRLLAKHCDGLQLANRPDIHTKSFRSDNQDTITLPGASFLRRGP